jgi:hypothetical protein
MIFLMKGIDYSLIVQAFFGLHGIKITVPLLNFFWKPDQIISEVGFG